MLQRQTHTSDNDMPSVLVVHNRYQRFGGEDAVVQAEVDLLRSSGARVETLFSDSQHVEQLQQLKKRPDRLVFNRATYQQTRALIRQHGIQVVHCHNLVPLLSTSIYDAAHAEQVPVVQTVHNYRMSCLNGLHLREGQVCERCRPGHHIDGIRFGCYRNSRVQSVAFGITQTLNAWRSAWLRPTLYVTPGPFLRTKLIEWGSPADRVVVKPHFVPEAPSESGEEGAYALVVGRLSPEKGLDLLLDAWGPERLPLVIVGDGPLSAHLQQRICAEQRTNVRLAGYQPRDQVNELLKHARFLIMPSVWFETFGLVVIEAYAYGVPVIATRFGAMTDVVRDGVTGLLFAINDRVDLARKIDELETDHARRAAMRSAARREYEALYSAQANIKQLQALYHLALLQNAQAIPSRPPLEQRRTEGGG